MLHVAWLVNKPRHKQTEAHMWGVENKRLLPTDTPWLFTAVTYCTNTGLCVYSSNNVSYWFMLTNLWNPYMSACLKKCISLMFKSPKTLTILTCIRAKLVFIRGVFTFLRWRCRCPCTSLKSEIQTLTSQARFWYITYSKANRRQRNLKPPVQRGSVSAESWRKEIYIKKTRDFGGLKNKD